jgi:hypothetical protein
VLVVLAACGGKTTPTNPNGSGIKECDDYIALVRKCAAKQEKDEDRVRMMKGADKMEGDMRHAGFGSTPDSDKDKKDMREVCASSLRGEAPVIGWCDLGQNAALESK